MAQRFAALKERHHLAFEVSFFFAGFLFDVVLLHRIDSTPLLIHQGAYVVLSAALIAWDHRLSLSTQMPTGWLGWLAQYRLWAMHFFLGTLLNAFLVFYFRASSGVLAFCFLVGLAAVIIINELPQFRSQGPIVRVVLWSFSITSYLAYLLPVVFGHLSSWHYGASVILGALLTVGLWKAFRWWTGDAHWTVQRGVVPGLVLQALLLGLYLLKVIPPVPLSLKQIGLYTQVTPVKDEQGRRSYELTYQPGPKWAWWADGSDTLTAPAGSRAYVFVRIFAPVEFTDSVQFAWEFHDSERGWTPRGSPFVTTLSGGSEEGFRTYAYSTLSRAGEYRVRVLTMDEREIGRQTFAFNEGESPPTHTRVE